MNGLDNILRSNKKQTGDVILGEWHQVCWTPDLATDELLNIGVVLHTSTGLHVKMLDTFDRVKCFYDEAYIETALFMTELVNEVVAKGELLTPSPHITFKKKYIAKGESIESILDYLFKETISLAKGVTNKPQRNPYYSENHLVNFMTNKIKISHDMLCDEIFPKDRECLVKYKDRVVPVNVPIRSDKVLASVVVANQKTAPTIEQHLMRGSQNIRIAKQCTDLQRKAGVIVLLPKAIKTQAIGENLEHFYADMELNNVKVISDTNKDALTDQLVEWAV